MKVLGIYGSPRKGGNTDLLLDQVLAGARSAGARVQSVYLRDLEMKGCQECGGCDQTGECILTDDMDKVYPLLKEAEIIFLASPIFFYGLSSQAKALIDRAQAPWSQRMLTKSPEARRRYDSGKGYLISLGATRGKNLFDGSELIAKYFYDALDKSYQGGLFSRSVEKKGAIGEDPGALKKAFDFGYQAVTHPERRSP